MSFNQQFDQHGIWRREFALRLKRLREALQKAQQLTGEIQSMRDSSFRQINADFGFSLQLPQAPEMIGAVILNGGLTRSGASSKPLLAWTSELPKSMTRTTGSKNWNTNWMN